MRNPWERNLQPSSSKITVAAVADTVAYPQLTGYKPTKRQLRYAYLTVPPEDGAAQEHNNVTSASSGDSSSSLPTVKEAAGTETQEHNTFTSAASGLQGGSLKKDWSPADDAETCPGLADQQNRVISQPRRRLACCTQYCEDGELTEAEAVAQKPSKTGTAASTHGSSSSSSGQSSQSQHKHQDDGGSTGAVDNEPTTGTATSTHGSSSQHKLQDDDESTGGDDAAREDPVAFPPLTGEKQRKKETRNAHLAPRP